MYRPLQFDLLTKTAPTVTSSCYGRYHIFQEINVTISVYLGHGGPGCPPSTLSVFHPDVHPLVVQVSVTSLVAAHFPEGLSVRYDVRLTPRLEIGGVA